MSGAALMLWIAGVHLLGLGCVALLMFPALKDTPLGPERRPDEGDDGWGRGPKRPPEKPTPPRGGIPLPDAVPARVRMREHGRLSERLPRHDRRPVREPARRPVREPHRAAGDHSPLSLDPPIMGGVSTLGGRARRQRRSTHKGGPYERRR